MLIEWGDNKMRREENKSTNGSVDMTFASEALRSPDILGLGCLVDNA